MALNTKTRIPYNFAIYLLIICISFLGMGCAGCYFLEQLDENYSKIIDRQLPALSLMRSIAKESGAGKLILETFIIQQSSDERRQLQLLIEESRRRNDESFHRLTNQIFDHTERQLLEEIISTRERCQMAVNKIISDATLAGHMPDTGARNSMNIAYDAYTAAQDRLADFLDRNAQEQNDVVTTKTRWTMFFFAVFAIWPIFIGLLIFFYGFVTTALTYYRFR